MTVSGHWLEILYLIVLYDTDLLRILFPLVNRSRKKQTKKHYQINQTQQNKKQNKQNKTKVLSLKVGFHQRQSRSCNWSHWSDYELEEIQNRSRWRNLGNTELESVRRIRTVPFSSDST